jgi:RNase adaptor protein for sRNA GlmZ degradation
MTDRAGLLLVSGMSGAGRSTAARALEDQGWFVIDNLPPSLVDEALSRWLTEEISSGSRSWWMSARPLLRRVGGTS